MTTTRTSRSRVLVPVLGVALALSSFALGGCGKSKVDQCNAFIERANKGQTVISSLSLDSEDSKKLEGDAAKIDAEAKAVGAVELKDAKLVGFRDQYSSNLTKLAGNVRDLAKLQAEAKAGKPSETQLKKIESDADKIEKDESKLVNDINAYCSGS